MCSSDLNSAANDSASDGLEGLLQHVVDGQGKLDRIIAALGTSGANVRAAKAVWSLLEPGRAAR